MLDKMLQKQKELQECLGYDFRSMTQEEITAYIKEFSIHLTQEMHEMLYVLPYFKPWKDYSAMTVEEYKAGMEEARKRIYRYVPFYAQHSIGA